MNPLKIKLHAIRGGTQWTKEESSSQKADVVQTDDSSWLIGYSLLFIGSGILLLKGRQYLE